MDNCYFAIIGDIVKSRTIRDRQEVQQKLEKALQYVNYKYQQEIASKFLLTLGDEFQGLLYFSSSLYDIILDIVESIEPVQIRFGIGLGTIQTGLKEYALGIDGDAFHKAREALTKARKQKGHAIIFLSDACSQPIQLAVNTIFILLAQIRNLWSEKQRTIYKLTRFGLTQNDIAVKLGVSQPDISKHINKARIAEVKEAQKNLSFILVNLMSTKIFLKNSS